MVTKKLAPEPPPITVVSPPSQPPPITAATKLSMIPPPLTQTQSGPPPPPPPLPLVVLIKEGGPPAPSVVPAKEGGPPPPPPLVVLAKEGYPPPAPVVLTKEGGPPPPVVLEKGGGPSPLLMVLANEGGPPPVVLPKGGASPSPPVVLEKGGSSPPPPVALEKGGGPSPPPMNLENEGDPPPPVVPAKGGASPPPPVVLEKGGGPSPPQVVQKKGDGPPPLVVRAKGGGPPPPPGVLAKKGGGPPPPPGVLAKGGGPPPPPGVLVKGGGLRPPPSGRPSLPGKEAGTKLKMSSCMGNLYRGLKGKIEETCITGKTGKWNNGKSEGAPGTGSGGTGKDMIAELAKKSTYQQQILADVEMYGKTIEELSSAIAASKTKDISEMLKFHRYVESHLKPLGDETQVLKHFGDFPIKKLETLRTAAGVYLKFEAILTKLVNWKMVVDLGKVESFFKEIKKEVVAFDLMKDEAIKQFRVHNIFFDLNIFVKIKESMVELSSRCMESAIKDGREAKARFLEPGKLKFGASTVSPVEKLWKVFQFTYQVYIFSGGIDDCAEKLIRELAQEIETCA